MLYFLFRYSLSTGTLAYSDDGKVVVACSSDYKGEVVIPQSVTEIRSTNTFNFAFKNCKNAITSIRFEENSEIVNISKYSFHTTIIETANLSECKKLTFLSDYTFENCYFLTTVLLPPSLSSIGSYCFYYNYMLSSIELPDSVTSLNNLTFFGSSFLTSINISETSNLERIGSFCFSNTQISSLFLPKNFNYLDPTSINDCPIGNITVHPENPYFKSDSQILFYGQNNFTIYRVIPSFSDTNYIIPSHVTNISSYCFYKVKFTSIELHNNIISIGEGSFSNCNQLKSIIIPEKVTLVNNNLFEFCSKLTTIEIKGEITKIGDKSFSNCMALTNIPIPNSLTEIGNYAFESCMSITSINIPENVLIIGQGLFSSCTSLTTVTLSNKIIEITNYMFYYCTKLISIDIPENVTKIGDNSFFFCKSLINIFIPNKVEYIGISSFKYCSLINNLTIPESVTKISSYSFQYCSNLGNITFINNNISIGYSPFRSISNPIDIFIAGNFSVNSTYKNAFPKLSHLYITNETILSESCKTFFGEKSVYVHMNFTTENFDPLTFDVIKYIAIKIIRPPLPDTEDDPPPFELKIFIQGIVN